MKITAKEEQNKMLENLLYNFSYKKLDILDTGKDLSLELFITTNCNKNCEYCYLQKNKEKLFP